MKLEVTVWVHCTDTATVEGLFPCWLKLNFNALFLYAPLIHVSYSGDGGRPYNRPPLLLWLSHIVLVILQILKTVRMKPSYNTASHKEECPISVNALFTLVCPEVFLSKLCSGGTDFLFQPHAPTECLIINRR